MILQSPDIEADIAALIAADYTPELIQQRRMAYLDRLKARVEATPPRSQARIVRQQELVEEMAKQIMRESAA